MSTRLWCTSRRGRPIPQVGAIALLVSSFVLGDAPVDQYAPFDKDSLTIRDNYTRLTWDRDVSAELTDVAATGYCKSGTRLPSVKELLSIVDEVRHKEQVNGKEVVLAVDGPAFGGAKATTGWFFSSTRVRPVVNLRLLVEIGTGEVRVAKDGEKARVRCVSYQP